MTSPLSSLEGNVMARPQPFLTAYPNLNARRVRELLNSEAYAPIPALRTLANELTLTGQQQKLFNIVWRAAMASARASALKDGYTDMELTAAVFVTNGNVLAP